jgi:hypothetical protein
MKIRLAIFGCVVLLWSSAVPAHEFEGNIPPEAEVRLCAFAIADLHEHLGVLIRNFERRFGEPENLPQVKVQRDITPAFRPDRFNAFRLEPAPWFRNLLTEYGRFMKQPPYPKAELIGLIEKLRPIGGQLWITRTGAGGIAISKKGDLVMILPNAESPSAWVHEVSHINLMINLTRAIQTTGYSRPEATRIAHALVMTPKGIVTMESVAISEEIETGTFAELGLRMDDILQVGNYPLITALARAQENQILLVRSEPRPSQRPLHEKALQAFRSDIDEMTRLLFVITYQRRLAIAAELTKLAEAATDEDARSNFQIFAHHYRTMPEEPGGLFGEKTALPPDLQHATFPDFLYSRYRAFRRAGGFAQVAEETP